MATAGKSRFRRGRGDHGDPANIEPSFRRTSQSDLTIEANDSPIPLELGNVSSMHTSDGHIANVSNNDTILVDDSLFPAFDRDEHAAPHDNISTTLQSNTNENNGLGFADIPRREVSAELGEAEHDNLNPKSRENSTSSRQKKHDQEKAKERKALSGGHSNQGIFNCFKMKKADEPVAKHQSKANENINEKNGTTDDKSEKEKASQDVTKTNDLPRYYRRIEYLKSVQKNCFVYPFYKCSRLLWMGYDNEEFKRELSFSKAYPSFDLPSYSQGWTLGVILHSIDTFRRNIIGLVRPIVKVHVVDMETGMYIKSLEQSPARPVFTSSSLATDSGSSAKWEEEVSFEADYADLVSEKSLLLFEIIDERPLLSTGRSKLRNKRIHHYKKIAWGYLLPIGIDGRLNVGLANRREINGEINFPSSSVIQGDIDVPNNEHVILDENGKVPKLALPANEAKFINAFESMKTKDVNLRVQLYQYREYDGLIGLIQRSILTWPNLNMDYESPAEANYPNLVPPVYLQWRMLRKQLLSGAFLRISVGSRVKIVKKPENTHRTVESEPEAGPATARSKKDVKSSKGKRKRRKRSKEERTKLRAAAMRRSRGTKDACVVPDKFLSRIEVGLEGAMAAAFSHSGHLLAIVSRMVAYHSDGAPHEIIYSLRLYDTDMDEEIWIDDVAHHSIIYDVKWTKNDRFLITCSGDGTCKIWDFLAFSPTLVQYTAAYNAHQLVLNRNKISNADDDTMVGTQLATARTANTYNTLGNNTGREFHLHDEMSPASIAKMYPPQLIQVLPLAAGVVAYCSVFQEFNVPFVLPPPIMQFKDDGLTTGELNYYIEQFNALKSAYAPRAIIGCSDGRIRVFDSGRLMGYVMVVDRDDDGKQKDFSPHDGVVNSLTIDERSKYLISADSFGDMLAWRLDNKGWYQLLRKFKRDVGLNDPALVEHFDNGSILSLAMHPDKLKGLMLVLSRQPSVLRVVNMSTYKPLSYCEGFTGIAANVVHERDDSFSTGVFHRAQFSADGKFICCCVQDTQNRQLFRLLFWETFTGHLVPSPLSKLTFPYPIRSIAWHPTQHLIAVSMTGPGAAISLYSADQEISTDLDSFGAHVRHLGKLTSGGLDEVMRRSTNSLTRSNSSFDGHGEGIHRSPDKRTSLPTIAEGQSSKSLPMGEPDNNADRLERTKAILAKVRVAKEGN